MTEVVPSSYPNGCHVAEVEIDRDTGADIFTLVRVSHIHLFGVTFIFFLMGLIFGHAYVRPVWLKCTLMALPFACIATDISSWYMVKVFHPFAFLTMAAGGLMATYISFGPFVGFDYVIIMYSGVVLGGMGSILGAFWGVIYLRRRSMVSPMISHAGFDLLQIAHFVAIRRSWLAPDVAAAAPDNDNALFNVSPRIGEHVGCTVLAATIGWFKINGRPESYSHAKLPYSSNRPTPNPRSMPGSEVCN